MFAENVMSRDVLNIELDDSTTVQDVVDALNSSGLHDLPVVDGKGKPVGLISARSILHRALPGYASKDMLAVMQAGPDIESIYKNLKAILKLSIKDFIAYDFEVVKTNTPTSAVAAMIVNLAGDTKDILVVDAEGVLVGVISARDIVCRQQVQIK